MSVASDGYLNFTANQLHRQAQFHDGLDLREKPYPLFRPRAAEIAPRHPDQSAVARSRGRHDRDLSRRVAEHTPGGLRRPPPLRAPLPSLQPGRGSSAAGVGPVRSGMDLLAADQVAALVAVIREHVSHPESLQDRAKVMACERNDRNRRSAHPEPCPHERPWRMPILFRIRR
jgi:hypothetical protein